MNYTKPVYLPTFILMLLLAWPALAAAPTFTVTNAGYAFNIYGTQGSPGELGNWQCDSLSETNGASCYKTYAAQYGMGVVHVIQNPILGTFVALSNAGGGGFSSVGDTEIVSWLHNTAQGNLKKLRESTISDDSLLPCAHIPNGGKCHWVLKDTLWGEASAGLGNFYTFAFAVDTGKLGTSKNSWLVYGSSTDGLANFQWQRVFEMVRPGGQATGSMNLTNNFRFIQDPSNAERWIGLMAWTFNDGTTSDSGTTPIYILPNQLRFGILFEDAGWCEFNMFTRFTGFNDVNACEGGNFLRFGGTWQGPLGDRFYKAPGLDKDVADLSLVNGQALVLKDVELGVDGHRCANYWLYGDYQSEAECAEAHASCGPDLDTSRYYPRSRDSQITAKRKPRRWTVRELNFSTWNTSLTGLSWNGAATTIQDGAQDLAFKINPTDNPTIGGFHGGQLVQHTNGSIYLYLPIKRTLCEPTEAPHPGAWDRWPAPTSGGGSMWLKLSSSG